MAHMMSDDELQELVAPVPEAPAPEPEVERPTHGGKPIPDPEPHVLERAQQLINEAGAGSLNSTLEDSSRDDLPTSQQTLKESKVELTDRDKLAFMAHVLGGQPYTRTYTAFRGSFSVTFRTLTAAEEAALADMVREEIEAGTLPKQRQKTQYHRYSLGASFCSYKIGDSQIDKVRMFNDGEPNELRRKTYTTWFEATPGMQYRLFDKYYRSFLSEVAELLGKADDPDFWPTPS